VYSVNKLAKEKNDRGTFPEDGSHEREKSKSFCESLNATSAPDVNSNLLLEHSQLQVECLALVPLDDFFSRPPENAGIMHNWKFISCEPHAVVVVVLE